MSFASVVREAVEQVGRLDEEEGNASVNFVDKPSGLCFSGQP